MAAGAAMALAVDKIQFGYDVVVVAVYVGSQSWHWPWIYNIYGIKFNMSTYVQCHAAVLYTMALIACAS